MVWAWKDHALPCRPWGPQMHYLPVPQPPPSGEKLAYEPKGGQKASCLDSLKGGKRRGLKCAQLCGGTVIRWTHHIKDKSRAYLKVLLGDNRWESYTGRNAQTTGLLLTDLFVKDRDKSCVVLENLCSNLAWKAPRKVHSQTNMNARIPVVSHYEILRPLAQKLHDMAIKKAVEH